MICCLLIFLCTSALFFESRAINSASGLILRPCKATEPLLKQCWLQKIEDLRFYLIRGIPELRLPSIDPLVIPKLTVGKKKSPAASFDCSYRNIVFTGAKNFHILKAVIDSDAMVFKLKIAIPSVHVATSYYIDGTMIGYYLLGDGSVEVSYTNLVMDLVLDGERYTNNGQEHIRWKEGSVEIDYENGNIQLYDIIKDPVELFIFNCLLNQNAESLRGVITSFLDRTLGNFVIEAINRVHQAFPANSLCPIY